MIEIIKDISIYGIGDLLNKAIGFLSIILYTHLLSKEEIGVFGYISVVVGFINTFLILGLDNAYARYFFEYKTDRERKILTTTVLIYLLVWSIIVLFLPLFFINKLTLFLLKNSQYRVVLFLAFLSLPLRIISIMLNQSLRNQFKAKLFVTFNFIEALISVGTTIFIMIFAFLRKEAIFLGMIIADLILIPFKLYVIRELLIREIDFNILKKTLTYGVPFLPASIAYWVFSSADRIMLRKLSTFESLGIYTVAMSLTGIMNLLNSAISQAWSPHAVKIYEENKEEAKNLYRNFLNFLIGISLVIIFFVSMIGKELINIILPKGYKEVFYPLFFLLVGLSFQLTTQVTAAGISLAKKTIHIVYITMIVAFTNIVLNYFFIPFYKEKGAALATMLSYGVLTLLYSNISKKFFPFKYDSKIVFLFLASLILFFILSFIPASYRYILLFITIIMFYCKRRLIYRIIFK